MKFESLGDARKYCKKFLDPQDVGGKLDSLDNAKALNRAFKAGKKSNHKSNVCRLCGETPELLELKSGNYYCHLCIT